MALEFRRVEPGDLAAVRAAVDPARSLEAWRWAYAENPGGSAGYAAFDGGAVVAHVGLISRRVWAAGKERGFAELTDLHEARPGHLALCAKALLEERGGPKGDTVVYGWPEGPAAGIATRLLGFETIRTETLLVREVGPGPAASEEVEALERCDEQLRWLFDRCAGELGALTIRDAAWMNWRYVDRPDRSYELLGVRDDEGVLRGVAVLAPRSKALALVDWLVPSDEPDVGERLLRAALASARRAGVEALETVLVPESPWFARAQAWGFRVRPARRFLLAKSFVRKLDDLWLRESWWTTLGDSQDP